MGKSRDSKGNDVWERDMLIVFCEQCLKEVAAGNRPTTHFNRKGWKNLVQTFGIVTGKEYDKTKLKSKWDQLKEDWTIWKELKHGNTGLGWDAKQKTICASDEWWTERLRVIPHAKKFRHGGIDPELEDKLDQMFFGVVAIGTHLWVPNQLDFKAQAHEHIEDSNDFTSPTEPVDDYVEYSRRQTSSLGPSGRVKKKKGVAFLSEQISQLTKTIPSTPASTSSGHVPPSIQEAIKSLEQMPEVYDDMSFYLFCTRLLEDVTKREALMCIPAKRRVSYLRYFYKKNSN